MKKYFFLSGLPRSGSTLLGALLNQHPDVHCGAISPVLEIMYHTEQYFLTSEQYQAYPKPDCAHKIVSSVIDNFYSDIDKPIVVDKCRAWPNNVDRIQRYITDDVKIICPVRSVLDILASFIALIHRNPDELSYIDKVLIEKGMPLTDDNRCDYLMSPEGIVDQSLYAFHQGFVKGIGKNMLLVEYDDLAKNAQSTMNGIYDWLGIDRFQHDLKNVDNKYREDDRVYDLKDMHEVRSRVEKIAKPYDQVLSASIIDRYQGMDFWRKPRSITNFIL
jgi:sulfotransferase